MRTMLIKFNFKNFKSFKNENCLDMEAASIKEHEYNTINIKDKKYLKVAAIYGANASGKTNVLEAFEFMKEKLMISDDTNMNSSEIDNYYNFSFDEKTRNEPIALEVTFLAENKKIYQYGFEIKNKVIVSEWLYVKKVNKSTPIFDRDENKVKFNKSYKAKINKFDVDSNSLFLSLYRKIEKDNEETVMEQKSENPEPFRGVVDDSGTAVDGIVLLDFRIHVAEQGAEKKDFQEHALDDTKSGVGAVEFGLFDEVQGLFLTTSRGDGKGHRGFGPPDHPPYHASQEDHDCHIGENDSKERSHTYC